MMRRRFDLTGDRFSRFGFREGFLAFNPTTACRSTLTMMVWGVVLKAWAGIELFEGALSSLPSVVASHFPCPLYLSGWGKLIFEDVSKVSMFLAPVAPALDNEHRFLEKEGQQVHLEAVYPNKIDTVEEDSLATEYGMNVYLEHPYGDLDLAVWAKGQVTLEVKVSSFVPMAVLMQQPDQYGYDRYREREASRLFSMEGPHEEA
jgi:hypothetical protein